MAKAKAYVYTDLSVSGSLTLDVDGVVYEVAQFTSSWAVNEVPSAVCMLALGRDVLHQKPAMVHTQPQQFQMQNATVYFSPSQEYDARQDWPEGRLAIFVGKFAGFAYRKINGKVYAIASLVHWLADMGCSSCLTKNGHVSNPTQLNAAAVLESFGDPAAGVGNYISAMVPGQLADNSVADDVWQAMKDIFVGLAEVSTMPVGPTGECGGKGTWVKNDVALAALARIEGPISPTLGQRIIMFLGGAPPGLAYKWAVPLKIDDLNVWPIRGAVAQAIGQETVESYAASSFWDKLVGQFCPMFNMAVVPRVQTALVVADTPCLGGTYWKSLDAEEYDAFDMSAELARPLGAVGVVASYESQTGAGVRGRGSYPAIGGCYAEDSVRPGDGVIMYVAPPSWLQVLWFQPIYAAANTGVGKNKPSKTSTTTDARPDVSPERSDTFGVNGNKLYQRYAHAVYANQMLRGRSGSVSGKLRFDVAPGSIIKVNPALEVFLGGEDQLAFAVFACVARVTVAINAEAGMAGTTFALSHVRTEAENDRPRTSVTEHPLFGKSIWGKGRHGAPLIDEYNL